MSSPLPLVPQYVLDDWLTALEQREPRALELAYGLAMSMPKSDATTALYEIAVGATAGDSNNSEPLEIVPEVRALLDDAYPKYTALTHGDFTPIALGNPNVLAFERHDESEHLLIVNNLARVPQPVKFKTYAGQNGWDILNRVEFSFPAQAQLEAYEFLWLMLN